MDRQRILFTGNDDDSDDDENRCRPLLLQLSYRTRCAQLSILTVLFYQHRVLTTNASPLTLENIFTSINSRNVKMTEDYFWGEYDGRTKTSCLSIFNMVARSTRCRFFSRFTSPPSTPICCVLRGFFPLAWLTRFRRIFLTAVRGARIFLSLRVAPGKPKPISHMVRAARSLCATTFSRRKKLFVIVLVDTVDVYKSFDDGLIYFTCLVRGRYDLFRFFSSDGTRVVGYSIFPRLGACPTELFFFVCTRALEFFLLHVLPRLVCPSHIASLRLT